MSDTDTWMPVFQVLKAAKTIHASHPTEAEKTGYSAPTQGNGGDVWQRIGTAIRNPHGSWTIHLFALPLRGPIIMRRPEPGERREMTNPAT
jgi:hypothetical protein